MQNKNRSSLSIYLAFDIVLIAVIAFGCSSQKDCTRDMRTSLGVSFFHPVMDETKQNLVIQPLNDTIKVQGVGNDSLINDTLPISSIRLPLKAFENQTAFVLQKDKNTADTITFFHENKEDFISVECGLKVAYNIVNVQFTNNRIDSVIVAISNINDNKTNNQVRIYFKVE